MKLYTIELKLKETGLIIGVLHLVDGEDSTVLHTVKTVRGAPAG